jgi:GTP-binding protein HflX
MFKFSSKPISEHPEVPLADDGALENIVESWSQRGARPLPAEVGEGHRVYVASIGASSEPRERAAQLGEIVRLVESQGDVIAGHEIARLVRVNPRTYLGRGLAADIAARARSAGATMLVLDAELSPSQTRNLEDVAAIPICDREAVILNVFLRHARTRRARVQVELAQLRYLRPRIRGVGLDMDQQTGGMAKARGPGETASELLARKIDGRIEELEKSLARARTAAATQRGPRRREACRRIVLVGYTNAGKTSLMNALTASDLSARDMPFETLDTTSRCLTRHGGDVTLGDTVGFIRRLPERLLASFDSTLAEVTEASLLAIVVDASDHERALHLATTHAVLDRLGAAAIPRLYVFNKTDRLDVDRADAELAFAREAGGHPWAALASHDASAVLTLRGRLLDAVRATRQGAPFRALVPYAETELLALVYGRCRLIESTPTEAGLEVALEGPPEVLAKIRARLGRSDVEEEVGA